jgi:S-formylglutathione hydrolase FrmB
MIHAFRLLLVLSLLFLVCCTGVTPGEEKAELEKWFSTPLYHDSMITIGSGKVKIQFAGKIKGVVLALPGWNFDGDDVCKNSDFCKRMQDSGYVLVLPFMGKSVYQSRNFPETRKDWLQYPTLKWVTDTLIPYVQKQYKLLLPKQNNFVYGISTGARGVAQLATHTKGIFKAGFALSGDYEQCGIPNDNLMKGYYGPFKEYRERWCGEDSPIHNIDRVDFPIALFHGKGDKVVPFQQTAKFADSLSAHKKLIFAALDDTAGHNYGFWGSQTDIIFELISKLK